MKRSRPSTAVGTVPLAASLSEREERAVIPPIVAPEAIRSNYADLMQVNCTICKGEVNDHIVYRCKCGQEYHASCLCCVMKNNRSPSFMCPKCRAQNSFQSILKFVNEKTKVTIVSQSMRSYVTSISGISVMQKLIVFGADIDNMVISSDQKVATIEGKWAGESFKLDLDNEEIVKNNGMNLIQYSTIMCSVLGKIEMIEKILPFGVDLNALTAKKSTALHSAIKFKHVAMVKFLLDTGVRTDIESEVYGYPTHFALELKQHESLNLLLEAGADINSRDKNGNSLLRKALDTNNLAALAILLQNKTSLSEPVPEDLTLSSIIKDSIDQNDVDAIKDIALHIIDLSDVVIDNEFSPLAYATIKSVEAFSAMFQRLKYHQFSSYELCNSYYYALKYDLKDILKIMNDNRVIFDVDIVSVSFQWAFDANDEKLFEKLSRTGTININTKLKGPSYTILEAALIKNWESAALFIFNSGAKMHNTTIRYACQTGNMRIIQTIINGLSHGNYWLKNGHIFLKESIRSGNLDLIKYMINRGFTAENNDTGASLHLHLAIVFHGIPEIIQFLIDFGSDVYKETIPNDTYLEIIKCNPDMATRLTRDDSPAVTALFYSRVAAMELLLKNGLNPNIRIFNKVTTLLHLACEFGNLQMARLLIKYGADTNALDNQNRTAFSYINDIGLLEKLNDMSEFL